MELVAEVPARAVKIVTSGPAADHIRTRGGRLYVWASAIPCCGGTRFIEASTDAPPDAEAFVPFEAEGFRLFIRPSPQGLPDEVHVDMAGLRKRRIRAFWNGCAFLV